MQLATHHVAHKCLPKLYALLEAHVYPVQNVYESHRNDCPPVALFTVFGTAAATARAGHGT